MAVPELGTGHEQTGPDCPSRPSSDQPACDNPLPGVPDADAGAGFPRWAEPPGRVSGYRGCAWTVGCCGGIVALAAGAHSGHWGRSITARGCCDCRCNTAG